MRWSENGWSRITAAALVAVFGLFVWRAATSAVTTDEAFTYLDFVAPPLVEVLTTYDANHHVLHSLLCKLSTTLLGRTDLTFRLPALLGAALYLWSAWRLTRRRFGETPLMAATALLLGLNAGMIDYFSVARGYSLGLGFVLWAMAETGEERYGRASLGLGLAVAANPVFAVPAAAWTITTLIQKKLWRRVDELAANGAVAALVVLALPVSRASRSNLYYGVESPWESWKSLLEIPRWPEVSQALFVGLPLLVLVGLWRERGATALTLGLCLAAIVGLHVALGFPYPYGRTGIYILPFVFLLVSEALRRVPAAAVAVGAVAVLGVVSMRAGVFVQWPFDSDNREIAQAVEALHPKGAVVVQFPLEFGLRYYRPGAYTRWVPGTQGAVYVMRADEDRGQPERARVVRRFARSRAEIWVATPEK